MTIRPGEDLRQLLDDQAGVITRQQAIDAGMARNAIYAKLDSGRWQPLHRGVYATFSGRPGHDTLLWAAVLAAGPRAVLSHRTAAGLQGLLATSRSRRHAGFGGNDVSELIHVTVPCGHRPVVLNGVRVHYSLRVDEARHPVLEPARTRVRWRAQLTGALGDARSGVQSVLEWRYLHDVEEPHGLPVGVRQRRVADGGATGYEDVHYRRYGLVVELDGQAAHPETERGQDRRRDNATTAGGGSTLRYTWADVTLTPCKVADEVGLALRSRGWAGELRPCGPDCPAGDGQLPGGGQLLNGGQLPSGGQLLGGGQLLSGGRIPEVAS
jgi:hypothetical protein